MNVLAVKTFSTTPFIATFLAFLDYLCDMIQSLIVGYVTGSGKVDRVGHMNGTTTYSTMRRVQVRVPTFASLRFGEKGSRALTGSANALELSGGRGTRC